MTADDQPPISERGRLPCRLRHRGSVTPRRPGTRAPLRANMDARRHASGARQCNKWIIERFAAPPTACAIRSLATSCRTKLSFTRNREVRPYGERAMAFILPQRPYPRNDIFCRLSDSLAAAAEFLDAGRALGILSRGGIRHRRFWPLALGLYGAPAA